VACLMGMVASLSPLSVEGVVPALPELAGALSITLTEAQVFITTLLLGLASGQLLWGATVDRIGRRATMILALFTYAVATVLCLQPTSTDQLAIFRFLQGVGAAGGPVVSRVVVRDWYSGEQSVRILGILSGIVFVAPAIAPILGGLMVGWLGWMSVFQGLLVLSIILLAVLAVGLDESQPESVAEEGLKESLGDRHYLLCLMISATAFLGMFSFVTGSPELFMVNLGFSSTGFGLIFFAIALGFSLGARLNRKTDSLKLRTRIAIPLILAIVAGGWVVLAGESVAMLGAACFLYYIAMGMLQPVVISAALNPYRRKIGWASSWLGCSQMSAGALASYLMGQFHDQISIEIGGLFAFSGVVGLLLLIGLRDQNRDSADLPSGEELSER
jgi:DHA1 family bicyclomycin/chloramphenicol resistance-like MFS transporter